MIKNRRAYSPGFKYLILSTLFIYLLGCTERNEEPGIFNIPSGFVLESVVIPELIDYPMFASFDDQGRLFVFESTEANDMDTDSMLAHPSYQIRLLTDKDGDGLFDQSTVFAEKIPFPMGGTYYDGSLYVAASPDILKYTDSDGDGRSDTKEVLLSGWTLNSNGAILSGPFLGPDGWMYVADARRGFDITSKEGRRFQGKGARIWRFLPDGSKLEWLSGGGFDNSIEIDFTASGDPIGTMTYFRDPADGQRDALMHWVLGGVYPKPQVVIQQDQLALTGDLMPVVTKMPRVAPAGFMRFRGAGWGAEFENDWFSAIFNTGQILRHHIVKAGGSYISTDTAFLSTDLPDVHPTDVLQDGNGDLLVVVTGGWFIHGCPLSQVAKPEVAGGIYRLRKEGAPAYQDPWGHGITFKDFSNDDLRKILDDDRPMVRKNAVENLISRGRSTSSIFEDRMTSGSPTIRMEALFALYRIHSANLLSKILMGLEDREPEVRVVASRIAGLNREEQAVVRLSEIVINDPDLGVKRQAATALGQIGKSSSIPSLIAASSQVDDRFLLHAIRYALISINEPTLLLEALQNEDPNIRISALIVLDQMKAAALQTNHLLPFLDSSDENIREVGIWVLQHHPEWSSFVYDQVRQWTGNSSMDDTELEKLRKLLVLFCDDQKIQLFLYKIVEDNSAPANTRVALLKVLGQCNGEISPEGMASLEKVIQTSNAQIRDAALEVIQSRQIRELASVLTGLLPNFTKDAVAYLKILNTRMVGNPELSEREFSRLMSLLERSNKLPVRRSAVQILSRASLNQQQLRTLAEDGILNADEVTFPEIFRIFKTDSLLETGELLVNSVSQQRQLVTVLNENEVNAVLDHYPEQVKQKAMPVLQILRENDKSRLAQLEQKETEIKKGDVNRGRNLFFGKALCATCHSVGTEGATFGPDLTNIGEIRSKHDLLEAIVFPAASFAREYETFTITTKTGTFTGLIDQNLTEGVIVLKTAPGQSVRLQESEITSIVPATNSMMPIGLDNNLSTQELSDLMAFLEALPYRIDRLIEISNKEVD
ncbi:MAG: HEAT repeat domain-containing protein [Saprospiraceae bacterium]|nr:HEAT repeat domain-containing protein [Saprospiraceae bacterium]